VITSATQRWIRITEGQCPAVGRGRGRTASL
jgi:hypothetical protein